MPRDFAIETIDLKPEARDRGRSTAQILAAEATRIAAAVRGTYTIALDERGAAWTTAKLAQELGRWQLEQGAASFVIGSADGLEPAFRDKADATISLSALTLPHALVRVLLAEQLYRAVSLLKGHPYHRE